MNIPFDYTHINGDFKKDFEKPLIDNVNDIVIVEIIYKLKLPLTGEISDFFSYIWDVNKELEIKL